MLGKMRSLDTCIWTKYRVFENEGQIEYGYKTLKFMVFDHEEEISVV